MNKQEEAIIILNGLADNPLFNDVQKEAIMLGAESLQAKEDVYKEFMRKAEELKEEESASRR